MPMNFLRDCDAASVAQKKERVEGSSPVFFTEPEERAPATHASALEVSAHPERQKPEAVSLPSARSTPLPVAPPAPSRKERSAGSLRVTTPIEEETPSETHLDLLDVAGAERPLRAMTWARAVRPTVIVVLLVLAGVGGILTALLLEARAQEQQAAQIAEETRRLRVEIQGTTATRTRIEQQLAEVESVRTLLRQHVRWTRFFTFLEAKTLPDVYYTNLSVTGVGHVQLSSIGRDFSAVARQLLAFEQDPDVVAVRMTRAATETAEQTPVVRFDLELTVRENLLFPEYMAPAS